MNLPPLYTTETVTKTVTTLNSPYDLIINGTAILAFLVIMWAISTGRMIRGLRP